MKCLCCGKPLSRMSIRRDGDFCCREHRDSYHLRQGLNRVQEAHEFSMLSRRRECPTAARLDRRPFPGPTARRVCAGDLPGGAPQTGGTLFAGVGDRVPAAIVAPLDASARRAAGAFTRAAAARGCAPDPAGTGPAAAGAPTGKQSVGARLGGLSEPGGTGGLGRGGAARNGVARGKRLATAGSGGRFAGAAARWRRAVAEGCGCADGRHGGRQARRDLLRPVLLRRPENAPAAGTGEAARGAYRPNASGAVHAFGGAIQAPAGATPGGGRSAHPHSRRRRLEWSAVADGRHPGPVPAGGGRGDTRRECRSRRGSPATGRGGHAVSASRYDP